MRKVLFAVALSLVGTPALASELFGTWQSEPSDTGAYIHVEIEPCAADATKVCGRIIDAFNGDPARPKNVVGRIIIDAMVSDGPNEWNDGTIWAPDDDATYASEMELKGDVLRVSGCVLAGLICRGQNWTRVR